MKNAVIIGAGIAGLTAGIYARRSGFNVTILEQHNVPGGLCSSWKRKGYFFEGGLHWLTASNPKNPMHQLWLETGALQDNNPVFYKDPLYTLIDGQKRLRLFRNTKKLKKELLDFAPEDKKAVKRLCRDISYFRHIHLPIMDKFGLKCNRHKFPGLIELLKMAPAVLRVFQLKSTPGYKYLSMFKNDSVRTLISQVINTEYNALSLIYTLGNFANGDSGYPEGGSDVMAKNMAKTFTDLGGKIEYHTKVTKVIVKDKKVTGLQYLNQWSTVKEDAPAQDLKTIECDSVIITQDARQAMTDLLDEIPSDKWVKNLMTDVISEQDLFFGLGVKADLSMYPETLCLPLKEPFKCAGLSFNSIPLNNYASYKNHAPEGCTTLSSVLLGNSFEYWQQAKKDGTYDEKKQQAINAFVQLIEQLIPETKGKIEVTDLATPCTNARYTGSWQGSYMSLWKAGRKSYHFPSRTKSVEGLYFAGQRMMMPGGLPMALVSGRKAAQELCFCTKTVFVQ